MATKRKRAARSSLVPESQRVFNGLTFCTYRSAPKPNEANHLTVFFPNNDINKVRRMRISKAVEYGGTWAKSWFDEVTHVIVDKNIKYSELLKFLNISYLPVSCNHSPKVSLHSSNQGQTGVVCVNETYLSDCLSYRLMVDPKQKQYEVVGMQDTGGATLVTGNALESLFLAENSAPAGSSTKQQTSPQSSANSDNKTSNSAKTSTQTELTLHLPSNELHSMASSRREDPTVATDLDALHLRRDRGIGHGNVAYEHSIRQKHMARLHGTVQARELGHTSCREHHDYYNTSHQCDSVQQRDATLDKGKLNDHVAEHNDGNHYDDALTTAIAEARNLKDIVGRAKSVMNRANLKQPLDLEDDSFQVTQSANGNNSSREDSDDEAHVRVKKPRKNWQENFQCMEKHDGSNRDTNPNARTIEVLEQMRHYYDRIDDHWRTVAYRRAVATLRKQPTKITTKEEALCLPFIGDRLAEKIQEIVWTNKLQRLDNALLDPSDQILQLFMQIYGVGLSQASRWVAAGFNTLDDLRNNVKLTDNQKIGLAHFDDFRVQIPRDEVRQHSEIVAKALQEIDSAFQATIGGSYRRGSKDSGDIDLIITKPDANLSFIRTVVLNQLVPLLFERGFLKAALAKTQPESGTKWHGASALPGSDVWRRIDFLLVPCDELGAALIYFTGNDIFNRSIRLLASKKGMRLNQHGLYTNVMRGKGRAKITEGELVEGKSEKKIFEILGVPWRPPEHRIC